MWVILLHANADYVCEVLVIKTEALYSHNLLSILLIRIDCGNSANTVYHVGPNLGSLRLGL